MRFCKVKAVIYARVSTQEQNLDNQVHKLREYAIRQGYQWSLCVEKESTRKTRPVKNEVYQDLLRGEYEVLLIYKFDRWARSTRELITDFEILVERGIKIFSYTEAIDLSSSMGKLQLTMLSAFAQFERDLIRERTLAGLERAKREGKTLGRPKGSKDKKYRKKRR